MYPLARPECIGDRINGGGVLRPKAQPKPIVRAIRDFQSDRKRRVRNCKLPLFSVVMFALFISPPAMRADIMGTTAGSSAIPAVGIDDMNFASTINVSYQNFCSFLLNGAQTRFPTTSFTFAGFGNIGGLFSPVVSSDFNVSIYQPWVVNNFTTNPTGGTNFLTDPSGRRVARQVQNQDVGGANVIINYTPRANSNDPTNVNFVQAFVQNTNNNNPGFLTGPGTLDSAPGTPFYNRGNIAGNGTTRKTTGTLTASPTSPAWLVDIPYRCESFSPIAGMPGSNGAKADCTGGLDDSLLSQAQIFQTFIESDQTVYYNKDLEVPYSRSNNGGVAQTWDVLYGGVQWGYNYTNADIPEPSTLPFLAVAVGAGLYLYRRRR